MMNFTSHELPLNLTSPIVQAPMAGGATTPELIVAVCENGGLGSLGAGMTTPEQLNQQINTIKSMTDKPFAVNLMVLTEQESTEFSSEMPVWLAKYYADNQLEVSLPQRPAEIFINQLQVLLDNPVAVASFTFGILTREQVKALQVVGTKVVGTANHPNEVNAWAEIGADMVCVQGSEAGGHRGGWLAESDEDPMGLLTLISQSCTILKENNHHMPLIAAGGIMSKQGIQAIISAGASMAQIGTAFLTTHESGINETYKKELLKAANQNPHTTRLTRLTRLFSGKQARGLVNEYMDKYRQFDNANGLPPYPQLNAMTKLLRSNAKETDNPEYLSLWAGQGVAMVKNESVAELMKRLW